MPDLADQIYSEKKALVGVFLGGPIAGAYYFWSTFKALGMSTAATFSPIVAALILVITLGSSFVPPFDRVPNVIFWSLQIGLVYGLYRGYLAVPVEEHLSQGKPEFGWGNTLTIAITSLIITLGILIGILYFSGVFNGPNVSYHGKLRHEIVFDEKSITVGEIDRLGSALTSAGFFDQELQKSIEVNRDGDRFILNLYCTESARGDAEFTDLVRVLRNDVQQFFPNNPIVIDMVIDTPDNRINRIE